MPFTNYFYNRFFAPEFDVLTQRELKAISDQVRPDVVQFTINSALKFKLDERTRSRGFNFIRRASNAIIEYDAACANYQRIFPKKDVRAYLLTLHHFEICLAETYQAQELLFGVLQHDFFEAAGSGRPEINWRMKRLHETAKHTEGFIRSAKFGDGDTIAMWISNNGLRTKEFEMSFDELFDVLCDMGASARIFARSEVAPIPEV